ncbi:MAG: ABC transporter permease [Gemmatimonadetes bacterium]|nr:ABC transporter permease [Gemmatimonadota bacterium]
MTRHPLRWLVLLFPAAFRRQFAGEMNQVLGERYVRARTHRGWWGAVMFFAREAPNLIRHALMQRFRPAPAGNRRRGSSNHRRGEPVIENLLKDMRYAARTFTRAPGFTAVIVLTLGLGIGANTAIFSVVNAVLLTPPPYESPHELVMVWEHNFVRNRARNVINAQNFTAWDERNDVFQSMAAMAGRSRNLTGRDEPRRVRVAFVSTGLFDLLGVVPQLGRSFRPEEIEPGNNFVVVLGAAFWRQEFGGDSTVIGQSVILNDQSHEIIGVMPESFGFPNDQDMWSPLALGPVWRSSGGRSFTAIARLKPDVSVQRAQVAMDAIAAQLIEQRPGFNTGWGINLVPLHEQIAGGIRPALMVLLGAVVLVLLIACANVANLLLSRAAARGKEFAVRVALGADRGRLLRQLLTESALLTAISLGLGLFVAMAALRTLAVFGPAGLPGADAIALNVPVLGFALALGAFTGMAFGLLPALHVSKTDVQSLLKEGGRSTDGGARGQRLRSLLVVTEMTLAIVLLVGAGLLIRSFQRLLEVDVGFNADGVLSAEVSLPGARYPNTSQQIAFFEDVVEQLVQLPQVESASAINFLPLDGLGAATSFTADDRPPPAQGESPVADVRAVHHDFFATMQIPVLQGRVFDGRERGDAELLPIVISKSMADRLWPDQSPLGKMISMPWDGVMHGEVIGVVGDVRHMGLETSPRSKIYWSHRQFPYSFMTFVVRTTAEPRSIIGAVQSQVWAADGQLPVWDIRTMNDRMGSSTAQRRFNMLMLAAFAGVALLLACVGIYGVMSYSVAQQSRELGLRMALGARPGVILRSVVGKGMLLAMAALVLGLAAAVGVTRAMTSLLFQVDALDPGTLVVAALILTGVALVACWLPARRATQVDPMVALRSE